MNRSMILLGMGVGAALMYALDPQQGNRRRALARDKVAKAVHHTGRAVGATSRDVAHRATGLAASVQSRFFEDNAPDEVVEARVRARLGRLSTHPGSIEVTAQDGVITLRGPVFTREMASVVRGISSVRGVERIENHLEPHEAGDHVPGLQGHAANVEPSEGQWSPTVRLLVGAAGAALTTVGLLRRDKLGVLLGGAGLALVTRAVTGAGLERLAAMVRPHEEEETPKGVSIPIKIGPRPDRPAGPPPTPMSDRIH